jgi:glycine C-acetyltransferase
MTEAGFDIKPGEHPIVPIMLYDSVLAAKFRRRPAAGRCIRDRLFFPVVPKGLARIRVQLSAGHERAHLDRAIAAFTKVGKELGVLK